jgi:hypothetical protein
MERIRAQSETLPTRDLKPRISDIVHGKQVEAIWACDNLYVIRFLDGTELQVAWVDDNGTPIKGVPAVRFAGLHVIADVGGIKKRSL